jgi:hypothetical protein
MCCSWTLQLQEAAGWRRLPVFASSAQRLGLPVRMFRAAWSVICP